MVDFSHLPIGREGRAEMVVTDAHTAPRIGSGRVPVLATPVMIMAMENAALNAIRPFLEPPETALGTVVAVRHLAATPLGQRVRAEAEVTKVDGRRIEFTLSARDESEEIGRGTHERMVVDYDRIAERVAAKRKP